MEKKKIHPYDIKIFVDCGAPSLYNKLSRKSKMPGGTMGSSFKNRKFDDFSYTESPDYTRYREDYIRFISAYKSKIHIYSNLDVINNPELTYKNQRILEEGGINPIPVFHLGSNPKWLKRYLNKYEYIALGGLVPNPTSVLIPILDRLFKDYLLDSNGYPKVKLHGFACTSLPLMLRYPWYSVDSATSRKLAAYGGILLPEHGKGKLKTILISTRDTELRYKITPGIKREIDRRAEKWGINATILGESIIERTIWNHLTFLEQIQKECPQWPWKFEDRVPKKGADEYLNLYFAGATSKKESDLFWNRLVEMGIEKDDKCRLLSFFYKSEAEHILSLKPKEK